MNTRSYTIRVPKRWVRIALIVGATALVVAPLTAVATHTFNDVPNTHTFHNDIAWLKDADVTRGCNPPVNDRYCPDDNVTRDQMAAFMRRLAENRVVDAGSLGGLTAGDIIDQLAESEPYRLVGKAGQPPFQNGWSNFGASFSEAGFYKDAQGLVHLKGTLVAGSNGESAFTLPAGYRPPENLFLPMAGGGVVPANLQILTNGGVIPHCTNPGCPAGIDGLTFRVGIGGASESPSGRSPND